jgi:hypothetical protein
MKEVNNIAKSTGRAQTFLSSIVAAVSQEIADVKFSIQSACPLNTRYFCVRWKEQSRLFVLRLHATTYHWRISPSELLFRISLSAKS